MVFEEVKDDEKKPCEKCGEVHEDIEETISEVRKYLDKIGPGAAFLKLLGALFVSVIAGGVIGLCYNHLAPIYLYDLPHQFQSVTWGNMIVLCFMFRSFALLVRGL